ncbi:MAG: hypothetical protein ACRC0G_12455 [Fusobacteriaceae bacterium]
MLIKTWFNVVFDEMFFYEYQKCQMRASYIINKNYTRRQYCFDKNKVVSVKAAMYTPYDDSLVYSINKKILFYAIDTMDKKGEVDASFFKKSAMMILEKEIANNKKKSGRDSKYYEKIRRRVISKLDGLFNLIDTNHFDNMVKCCYIEKIKLPEVIELIRKGVLHGTAKSIPNFDYIGEYPLFKCEILALTYVQDTGALNIVISQIFNVTQDMVHRNFFIKILYRYFDMIKDKLNYDLAIEVNFIDRITIYNPLTLQTIDVYFEDVKSSLPEMDLFRTMSAYIDNNCARSLDNTNCEFCENKRICYSKTRSKNIQAIEQTLGVMKSKGKPKEMI